MPTLSGVPIVYQVAPVPNELFSRVHYTKNHAPLGYPILLLHNVSPRAMDRLLLHHGQRFDTSFLLQEGQLGVCDNLLCYCGWLQRPRRVDMVRHVVRLKPSKPV